MKANIDAARRWAEAWVADSKNTKIETDARLNALLVIALTPSTFEWLAVNDPQALKQVHKAVNGKSTLG